MWRQLLRMMLVVAMLCFALLQLNDPDPFIWMSLYLIPVFPLIWGRPTQTWRAIAIVLGVFYGIGALWMWPAAFLGLEAMSEEKPQVEAARESLGLAIAMLALFLSVVVHKP